MPSKCDVCKQKQSYFGMPNDTVANHCGGCKLDGMINIKHRKCIVCKQKGPCFGMPNDTVANHCGGCKLDGMVDIKRRKCDVCKQKRPNFAMPNDTVANHCGGCKLDGMIDIKHPKCVVCKQKRPNFAMPNDTVANHCGGCKLDGMIDIKHPKCVVCKQKIPHFGMPNDKVANHCGGCKLDGMIDIRNPKCDVCKQKGPCFGMPNDKVANHCGDCKLDGMINIKHRKCVLCQDKQFSNPKYEGYCLNCFLHTFPDKPVTRNYKTKEKSVVDYIKQHFPYLDIVWDKSIKDGCSKKRPDLMIDLGYQVIFIEIDENQHQDYDCSCENKRIMELSQDVGHRPIIFIRFNPDDYKKDGKKVSSCWSRNKLDILTISKNKKEEWDTRLKNLKDTVDYWICEDNKTDRTVNMIGLYYDT